MSETKELNKQECQSAAESCSAVARTERYARPRYAIRESERAYVVEVDVPGVAKGDVEITLEEGVLEIVGRRNWDAPKGWTALRGQRSIGSYKLKLAIGDYVDGEKISASVDNGVLTLTLEKFEDKQPRKIEIA